MLRYTRTRKVTFSVLGVVVALGLLCACDDNSKVTAASVTSETVRDDLFYKYANNPESEKRITFFPDFPSSASRRWMFVTRSAMVTFFPLSLN
jgi:hypothetical protein